MATMSGKRARGWSLLIWLIMVTCDKLAADQVTCDEEDVTGWWTELQQEEGFELWPDYSHYSYYYWYYYDYYSYDHYDHKEDTEWTPYYDHYDWEEDNEWPSRYGYSNWEDDTEWTPYDDQYDWKEDAEWISHYEHYDWPFMYQQNTWENGTELISDYDHYAQEWPEWSYYELSNNNDHKNYFVCTRCQIECSQECVCSLSNNIVACDCAEEINCPEIQNIPYPSGVRSLAWTGSTLHAIMPQAFSMFAYTLHTLYLNSIGLRDINPGAFDGLTPLLELILTNNDISEIAPGVFNTDLRWLFILDISRNNLRALPHGGFASLTWLFVLDLSHNFLAEVGPGDFPASLDALDLSNNDLADIAPGTFASFTWLFILDLSNNHLSEVGPGDFPASIYNYYGYNLDLSCNNLTAIAPGTFRGLSSSTQSDNDSRHDELVSDKFDDFINLYYLDISCNSITEIASGTFKASLEYIDLSNNQLIHVQVDLFNGMTGLTTIKLSDNDLTNLTPVPRMTSKRAGKFPPTPGVFGQLTNLKHLKLSMNKLTALHSQTFQNQTSLTTLELDNNRLEALPEDLFHNLKKLRFLDLEVNRLVRIKTGLLRYCTNLQLVSLHENPLMWIERNALDGLDETSRIIVGAPSTCCFTAAQCISKKARSPVLTCKRLLPYKGLRISIWLIGLLTIFGNLLVFGIRYKFKHESRPIQSFLITNLSIADTCMGIYLIVLISADIHYNQYFPSFSQSWRSSVLCRVVGAFYRFYQVKHQSTFFITLIITIERLMAVKYTFSDHRFSLKNARVLVVVLWLTAFAISAATFVLSKSKPDLYTVSEICVGLPLSRQPIGRVTSTEIEIPTYTLSGPIPFYFEHYQYLGTRAAMFFSIATFTVLNLVCFFIVGYSYLAIFIHAKQATINAGRTPRQAEEIKRAVKIFAIVFTDFCCWVPIGILSILVQADVVVLDPVAYVWIATFVLPINSAINPFLYTLGSFVSNRVEIVEALDNKFSERPPIDESGV